MTFCLDDYKFWNKEYPMFIQWALNKGILFPPRESMDSPDECYDLTSKLYLLMKRLKQDYLTLLKMPTEERDRIFQMELELLQKEEEDAKKIENQN